MAIAAAHTDEANGIRSRTVADLLPAACRVFAGREAVREPADAILEQSRPTGAVVEIAPER